MDLSSLEDRQHAAGSVHRQLQRRSSRRTSSSKRATRSGTSRSSASARKSTDLIDGTLLHRRPQRPALLVADLLRRLHREERDNQDIFVKGSYFLSTSGSGSHNMVVRLRQLQRHPLAPTTTSPAATTASSAPTPIVPGHRHRSGSSCSDGTTQHPVEPDLRRDRRASNFRTHSVFFNDSWRVNDRLTANLGLRCDKNDGDEQARRAGRRRTSAFSPRLGVVWDPTGDGEWSVTGSVAQVRRRRSPTASPTRRRRPATRRRTGSSIAGRTSTPDPAGRRRSTHRQAIQAGVRLVRRQRRRQTCAGSTGAPTVPGVTPQIGDSLQFAARVGIRRPASAGSSAPARPCAPTSCTATTTTSTSQRTDTDDRAASTDTSFAPQSGRSTIYAHREHRTCSKRRYPG